MEPVLTTTLWLRPEDCLAPQSAQDEPRLRFLEQSLTPRGSDELMQMLLGELTAALRVEQVLALEATAEWPLRWYSTRRGARPSREQLPRGLLGEVLERRAGVVQPATAAAPAQLLAPLLLREGPQLVLWTSRSREPFARSELAYAVAASHYLGQALLRALAWDAYHEETQRLLALIEIGEQLIAQRETVPLLEHIAAQATKLLDCERASIFLWDEPRRELVGRPALGMPNNELRISDQVGVVGKVLQTGEVTQVDDVHEEPAWHSTVDKAARFQTRSLLCVPLVDTDNKRLGVFEVMNKKQGRFNPRDVSTLQALARQTLAALGSVREHEALVRSQAELEGQARQGSRIIGDSTAIKVLRDTLERVARTELPVLILGESGTGKDVSARAVHYASARHKQPYVPVNCAAIAESLLESELFGHEKGAFTDAHTTRPGKFEAASGGTLFLDEIGDLSAGGQAKLLRVLEEKVVYRVGGTQAIPVDTRIVAATNRNLAERVRAGKFREDLFYRLSVVTVDLPPLRERRDDILVLIDYFLQQFCRAAGRKTLKFSADARKRLEQHDWPGNIRELRNLVERIAYLCPNDRVEAQDLPFIVRPVDDLADEYSNLTLGDATKAFQTAHIKAAIDRAGGNMSDAAKLLGLYRPNLYRKMKLLEMDVSSLER